MWRRLLQPVGTVTMTTEAARVVGLNLDDSVVPAVLARLRYFLRRKPSLSRQVSHNLRRGTSRRRLPQIGRPIHASWLGRLEIEPPRRVDRDVGVPQIRDRLLLRIVLRVHRLLDLVGCNPLPRLDLDLEPA